MNRINPESLVGPRAYFTDFDHRIIARSRNQALLLKKGERKLKVLLLLKGRIVIAASHLATKFAYDFFRKNSGLLTTGAVLPAFRADKTDLSELFTRKRFAGREDAIPFYDDHVQSTVTWKLEENSGWFRDRFIADLEDDRSVLRRHFGEEHQQRIVGLLNDLRKENILGRDVIDHASKGLPMKYRRLLQNYRELLYHVSGARVVNCESALPQENYIDYDLADLSQRRARLTEEQVLWKLLIELVLDSLQRAILPVEMLDSITFADILKIRQPILQSNFQYKYDKLISSVLGPLSANHFHIFDVNELEQIRAELARTFDEVIDKELPSFLKKKALQQSKQLATVSASVALDLAGAVPGVGLIASAVGVLKDSPALFFNVGQTYRSIRAVDNLRKYYANKEEMLEKEIERHEVTGKAPLHEMVDLLTSVLAQKITM
jgi:hypothetical protein